MADMFFQEDDFVITFDPTQVIKVTTWDYAYSFQVKGSKDVVVHKKYETLCKVILSLVKDNFEKHDQLEQTQIPYKLEGFVSSRFVLSFPNLKDYNEALQLVKDSLSTKFGHEPWINQSVRNLQFAINFPSYYTVYEDNKALIISILGEPNHANS